jgi:hypothetical protein
MRTEKAVPAWLNALLVGGTLLGLLAAGATFASVPLMAQEALTALRRLVRGGP